MDIGVSIDNNKVDLLHIQKFVLYREILQPQYKYAALYSITFSQIVSFWKKIYT